MQIPLDYKDLLRRLNKHRVRYLIVGAYAVTYYTEPRFTKDLDIWIDSGSENAKRVYRALKEFGAPLRGIKITDFANPDLVYQIGIEPVRVDIIMAFPGLRFDKAWRHRRKTFFNGVKVNIIGINELIRSKRKTERPLDKADIASLKCRLKMTKKRKKRR